MPRNPLSVFRLQVWQEASSNGTEILLDDVIGIGQVVGGWRFGLWCPSDLSLGPTSGGYILKDANDEEEGNDEQEYGEEGGRERVSLDNGCEHREWGKVGIHDGGGVVSLRTSLAGLLFVN